MEVQLMKKNKALEAQAPFKPNSFLPKTLNPDKKIYGLDMEINKVNFFLLKETPKVDEIKHLSALNSFQVVKSNEICIFLNNKRVMEDF